MKGSGYSGMSSENFMDDKEAAEILIALSKKAAVNAREKEALAAAIGVLSWTALAKSRLKNLKAGRRKASLDAVKDEADPA